MTKFEEKQDPEVDVYMDGQYQQTVSFKKKWHARLFHIILNKSIWHDGVRHY